MGKDKTNKKLQFDSDEEQPVVEQKKTKKSKNEEAEPVVEKKSKKQKKVESEEDEPVVEKKTKKNKKKAESEEEEETPKKKSKKSKKQESDDEEAEEEAPKKKAKKESATDITTNGSKSGGSYTNPIHRKIFYKEHPALAKASAEEIQKYWKEHSVTVSDKHSTFFRPTRTFEEVGFVDDEDDTYKNVLKSATSKFTKPSPIQASTWPVALSGRDVVGVAETGSGKTLAFLLPALVHIMDKRKNTKVNSKKKGTPTVLVLSPTRELAMQSQVVAEEVGQKCRVKSVCIYGGAPKYVQVKEVQDAQIVVATPGRLQDLMEDGAIDLSLVSFLVLDEADRMLDMGFEREVRKIVSTIPKMRQTLMFSATWPTSIQKLANEYLEDPVKVTIGSLDLTANKRVTQIVEVLEDNFRAKTPRLMKLLKEYHKKGNRILIFVLYKKEAPMLEDTLGKAGYSCGSIHSDKTQTFRTKALEDFKSGKVPLLIATDVAARGLDIPDVEYVINYSFPLTIEDYIHRIGRTGRGGKSGISHTFFTVADKSHSGELCNVLREAGMEVPEALKAFGTHIKKKEHAFYGSHFKDLPAGAPTTSKKITFDSDDE